MYLDFEDYRPDIQPIGRAISWREGVLLSIIVHLVMVILVLLAPQLFPFEQRAAQPLTPPPDSTTRRGSSSCSRASTLRRRGRQTAREPSDKDRLARAPEQAKKPTDPLPFSRGNTPERVESVEQPVARGQGPAARSGGRRRRRREPEQCRDGVAGIAVGAQVALGAPAGGAERCERPSADAGRRSG